jgi:hypothetical protein
LVAANGLQIRFCIFDLGNIPNDIHHGRRDPTEVVQFIELDIKPFAIDIPPAHRPAIAGV